MSRLFSQKDIVFLPLKFFGVIIGLHLLFRSIRYRTFIDIDNYWPVSIFLPKLPSWQDIFTLIAIGSISYGLLLAYRKQRPLKLLLGTAALLIIATNLLQGIHEGFIDPIAGTGRDHQYWQDVDNMSSLAPLLKYYTRLQPILNIHSRVHPPGPMIVLFLLRNLWANPIFISLFILALSTLSAFCIYDLLITPTNSTIARFSALLFLLLPGIQIYFVSSIDAVIVPLFIGTYWAFIRLDKDVPMLTAALLFLSSVMTFAAVFIIPIIAAEDWFTTKSLYRFLRTIAFVGLGFFLLYYLTGYNYLESFSIAKSFEGSAGFYGFTAPVSYVVTRIEGIVEIIIFLGPFLTYLLYLQIRRMIVTKKIPQTLIGPLAAIASLTFFLLLGAYYTGETARAAMYIYPFLMLIIGHFLHHTQPPLSQQTLLLTLVFVQSLLMQLFGWYGW